MPAYFRNLKINALHMAIIQPQEWGSTFWKDRNNINIYIYVCVYVTYMYVCIYIKLKRLIKILCSPTLKYKLQN